MRLADLLVAPGLDRVDPSRAGRAGEPGGFRARLADAFGGSGIGWPGERGGVADDLASLLAPPPRPAAFAPADGADDALATIDRALAIGRMGTQALLAMLPGDPDDRGRGSDDDDAGLGMSSLLDGVVEGLALRLEEAMAARHARHDDLRRRAADALAALRA